MSTLVLSPLCPRLMYSLGLAAGSIALKPRNPILAVSHMIMLGGREDPQLCLSVFSTWLKGALDGPPKAASVNHEGLGKFTLSFENSRDIYITVYYSTF